MSEYPFGHCSKEFIEKNEKRNKDILKRLSYFKNTEKDVNLKPCLPYDFRAYVDSNGKILELGDKVNINYFDFHCKATVIENTKEVDDVIRVELDIPFETSDGLYTKFDVPYFFVEYCGTDKPLEISKPKVVSSDDCNHEPMELFSSVCCRKCGIPL